MDKRPAQATLDLVLHENKVLSATLYVLAVLSVLVGITVLGVALWRNQPITAVAGVVAIYLFIPAWRFFQKLRRENIMIRLLQVGLNNAQTASEAVDKIREAFEEQLRQEGKTSRDEGDSPRAYASLIPILAVVLSQDLSARRRLEQSATHFAANGHGRTQRLRAAMNCGK